MPVTPQPTALSIPTDSDFVNPEAIDWPTQVVYNSPLPGEEVTLDGAITFIAASQVIPAPGTDNVQTDCAITVLFNRPIGPLTATG